MKTLLTIFCFLSTISFAFAQGGISVNTTGTSPDNSAMLDVQSTTKGILIPRMTEAQRTAIASPATGLMVYQTNNTAGFYYYNGSAWTSIGAGSFTPNAIKDADANTKVEVEKTPNDDLINFTLKGVNYFKMRRGTIEVDNTGGSLYFGNSSGLIENYDFNYNVGIGANTLQYCDSCYHNVALGYRAMQHLEGNATYTKGGQNTAIGKDALMLATQGNDNTSVGYKTLAKTTIGDYNVAVGSGAGNNNITGSRNVFLGYQSGANETGSNKLYIDNSNTTSPLLYGDFSTDLLRVNGTLNVNNAYSLPTVAGTANQYLQTNGAGVASWVTPSFLSTETDPKIGTLTTNYLPKWNGTTLANGLLYDNGTNVGIGTASPTEKLDVAGKTRTTNFQMTTGATNGYILKSDASGNGTWVNPSTVSVTEIDPKVASTTANYVPKWDGASLVDGLLYDSGLYMGIGTTTPGSLMHLEANSNQSVLTIGQSGALDYTGINYRRSNTEKWFVGMDDTDNDFIIKKDILTEAFVINTTTGNVGINNPSPTEMLDVVGKTKTTNFQMTTGASNGYVLQSNASGNGTWVNPTSLAITESDPQVGMTTTGRLGRWNGTTLADGTVFDNGTNVGIGTTLPTSKLHLIGDATLAGIVNFNNSWNIQTGSDFYLEKSGTRFLTIYGTGGNVGIGTNAPTEKLDVVGKTKTTNLQMTSGATNGYVLQGDASGNASWVNPTTLSNGNWTKSGSNQYSAVSGNVGIGTTTPNSTLSVNGSITVKITIITTSGNSTTLGDSHYMIIYNTNTSGNSLTLPAANTCAGRVYIIVNHTNNDVLTSTYYSSFTSTSSNVMAGNEIQLVSDGTNWRVIN